MKQPKTCHPCKWSESDNGHTYCRINGKLICWTEDVLRSGWPVIGEWCPKKHKLKRMWRRIKRFFRSIFGGKKHD